MKALRQIAVNQRLRGETAWRLLAADNAPVVLGLLQAHLLERERRLPSSILHERIERDLELLRAEGRDLPQSARAYVAQWLRDGYLERSYRPGANEEEYELGPSAVQAIRFVQELGERRAVATESRLALVIRQLVLLAEQTETDPASRIEHLEREHRRIEAEIEAVQAGRVEALPEERALERVREIVALADELAADFQRVRAEFGQLNRELRERIVEGDGSRGEVLTALFEGVDLIAESDAGRTFKAFWRLLTDPEQSLELEAALDQVLARDFARRLERDERRFLLRLTKLLLERGADVHEVLQRFARSLKQFVQSREYLAQRRLTRLLRQAQRGALEIKDRVRPADDIGHGLVLTSSAIRSVAQLGLHDPSLDAVEAGIALAEPAAISLEAVGELVAHSEIDFRRLKQHVRAALVECDQVSISAVLSRYPAEQGLGSVVGYLALGARHGVVSERSETVAWEGLDGVARQARIPCVYFVRERRDELA